MKTDRPRVVLAGGRGFLGHCLAGELLNDDYEVAVLTRAPSSQTERIKQIHWDGETPADWARQLDGALAVVNLAGRSVNCRYHARNRQEILESRVDSTRVLGDAIARCAQAPRVWLNSSTATIYKHSLARPMDEATGESGAMAEARG